MRGVIPLIPLAPLTPLSKMLREAAGDKGDKGGKGDKGDRVDPGRSSAILGEAALGLAWSPGAASHKPRIKSGRCGEKPWSPAEIQLLPGVPGERVASTLQLDQQLWTRGIS